MRSNSAVGCAVDFRQQRCDAPIRVLLQDLLLPLGQRLQAMLRDLRKDAVDLLAVFPFFLLLLEQ